MKEFEIEKIKVSLGQNAQENWKLLSKYENEDFIWMHLDAFPSGSVIIQSSNPSEDVLIKAGNICRKGSKYNFGNTKICFTSCKNIEKGDFEGEIVFKSNRKVKKFLILGKKKRN